MGEIIKFSLGVLVIISCFGLFQCNQISTSKENSVLVHFMDKKRSEVRNLLFHLTKKHRLKT